MRALEVFAYLQLLDVLTTLVGMRIGAQEASPFVRVLMHAGPVAGLLVSKFVAFGLVGVCLWARRRRVVVWVNYWYAALVIWNFHILFRALPV